ncbi:MAG: LemA family protein [Chitinophagales bacterium]|nr:LemA family protein [Chitinophagales bacterium]
MTRTILKFFGLFLIAASLSSCGYNSMVNKDEMVAKAWADVETQYQRRADLIPNLVTVVKQASTVEQQTLTAVIEARSKATSITLQADDLTEENLQKFQDAQNELSGSLSRLLVAVEQYPTLQSQQGYIGLRDELAGTENRIQKARKDYNEVVTDYNSYIRRFPNNLFAGMFGFKTKPYFKADSGTEKVPTVKF